MGLQHADFLQTLETRVNFVRVNRFNLCIVLLGSLGLEFKKKIIF